MTSAGYFIRLALPGAMAALLLLSLAYWWLDNLPHELFGTAVFALLGWHFAMNRVWFKNLFRGKYSVRRAIIVALHLVLIVNMLVLFLTSIIISKSVFSVLPIPDSIYLRDVHWFSAYWVMIIVGIHVGLHWTRVMAIVRSLLRLSQAGAGRALTLKGLALLTVAFGLWSWSVLGVWGKLTFTYSLEFWDFTASVSPFFGHWAGVMALPAVITHYTMVLLSRRRQRPASIQAADLEAQEGGWR